MTAPIDHARGRRLDDCALRHKDAGETQDALTCYRRLAMAELRWRVDRHSTSLHALLELEPLTGRMHQIRRHLKHLSRPVIGDTAYGKERHDRLFQ